MVTLISAERKRKRAPISCALCRRRKIRCNRETPCSNCIRSRNTACVYETEPWRKTVDDGSRQTQLPGLDGPPSTAVEASGASPADNQLSTSSISSPSPSHGSSIFELQTMKARIAELEEKLSQASTTNTASLYSTPVPSPVPTHPVHITTSFSGSFDVFQDSRGFGSTHAISRGVAHKNRVFGQSHWMNGFLVFRDLIEMMEPRLRSKSSSLMVNLNKAKVLARVIKSQRSPAWPTPPTRDIPAKHVCDALTDIYLQTIETLHRVVHIPSFKKDYDALWNTTAEPPMGFIILLKLILAIGASMYDENFSLRRDALRWMYEAHTWLSAPSFKSRLGIQYMQISILLIIARDTVDVGSELVWISVGSVLRAAVYIGLHKDPARLSRMTFFEVEMRRRVWNTLLEVSLQTSLESGGPCYISFEEFNTEPPGNFDDEDLVVAGQPAPKPNTIFTQTSAAIAVQKTFATRVTAIRFLNDIASAGTYKETLQIDTALRAAYKTLRDTLHGYALNAAVSGPSTFLLQAVDFTMQRYISSLHVPYLGPSLQDPVYAFSRKAVVDASLKMWTLARPGSTQVNDGFTPAPVSSSASGPNFSTEPQLARLCRCGSGFFRTSAFHASSFIGTDLRAQVQEDNDISSTALPPSRSTLIDDAAQWYLQCMQAGETGIKGYLLLRFLITQIDATRRRVQQDEIPNLVVAAAEQAAEKALSLLEEMVGQQPEGAGVAASEEPDLRFSPDFMEDWDMVMSDTFHFGDGGSFDAFLI